MDKLARKLQPAEGYFELQMYQEAWDELDQLAEEAQHQPVVLEFRTMIQMNQEKWEGALYSAESLCEAAPDEHSGFIHAAYCLHELGKTEDAKNKLYNGPATLQKDPLYFYNLACYEAQLGETDTARNWLNRACKLDESLETQAQSDPDLQPLWE